MALPRCSRQRHRGTRKVSLCSSLAFKGSDPHEEEQKRAVGKRGREPKQHRKAVGAFLGLPIGNPLADTPQNAPTAKLSRLAAILEALPRPALGMVDLPQRGKAKRGKTAVRF